jgi:hypothetical protein
MSITRARLLKAMASTVFLLVCTGVSAQSTEPAVATTSAPKTFNEDELAAVLAPIALYPDTFVAQILMASTYLLEDAGNLKSDAHQTVKVESAPAPATAASTTVVAPSNHYKMLAAQGRRRGMAPMIASCVTIRSAASYCLRTRPTTVTWAS